ncbi:LutC/YkgG family protein [Derxia gummosa]|uniref:LutC/YkgG family protein n=1 Tax=Derxia gummosa DSM 723 TaxID=1121388 RepID=A0A8B6XB20_9BURK|nr:lactate utilization protein [Derxia gummosa]
MSAHATTPAGHGVAHAPASSGSHGAAAHAGHPAPSARDRILGKLRAAREETLAEAARPVTGPAPAEHTRDEHHLAAHWVEAANGGDVAGYYSAATPRWSAEEKLLRFVRAMRAVHTEVHLVRDADWPAKLAELVAAKGLLSLLVAQTTPHGARAAEALAALPAAPRLLGYDRPIEQWKAELFRTVDAGFTGTRAAIAETGSLIVWPDAAEPRTQSLVPPIHIALADGARIHANFHEAVTREGWAANGMPTNALLISGPSKTSDIQQTLAYGAHGPRELVLLLVVPAEMDIAALEARL